MNKRRVAVASAAGVALAVGMVQTAPVGLSRETPARAGLRAADAQASAPAVLVGAGDIALCGNAGAGQTANLVKSSPGTVFTLGDNVQGQGTASEFRNCYGPTWGQFKSRTRPALGNHEYLQTGATPYFDYFGSAAGPRGKGYYSYDVGDWHVVVLNTSRGCNTVSCSATSPQNTWLKSDLAANAAKKCTVAMTHHPRFSVGYFGDITAVKPLWDTLYTNNAELVLSGHDHIYQRFRPMRPDGTLDTARGITQVVAGTGGYAHGPADRVNANLVTKNRTTFGVVKLTLSATGAQLQYISTNGSYSDSVWIPCH